MFSDTYMAIYKGMTNPNQEDKRLRAANVVVADNSSVRYSSIAFDKANRRKNYSNGATEKATSRLTILNYDVIHFQNLKNGHAVSYYAVANAVGGVVPYVTP